MKKFRLLLMMLAAAALPFTACQNSQPDDTPDTSDTPDTPAVVDPTVSLALVDGSVTSSGFQVNVTTANVEAAKWYLAFSDEDVTAETVFGLGTPLTAEQLNTTATVSVEALAGLDFHFYVVVSKGETNVLSQALPVTTPNAETVEPDPNAPTVIEFYAMASMGMGSGESSPLTDFGINRPGHYLTLTSLTWSEELEDVVYYGGAQLPLLDYEFFNAGLESCTFLTSHHYPLARMNFGEWPETSCLVVDPTITNFQIGEKTYYPYVPEETVDADGNPYGVTVQYSPAETSMDMSVLVFNVPAVDEDGNYYVIVGQYEGPLGYQFGGGSGPSKIQEDLNLDVWRIKNFTGKVDAESNTLVLKANGGGAFLTLNLWLGEDGSKEWANADGVTWTAQVDELDQPMGPLTGTFDNDPFVCNVSTGAFTLYTTETEGEYLLVPGRNGGLQFVGENIVYTLVRPDNETGGYTVTITMQE